MWFNQPQWLYETTDEFGTEMILYGVLTTVKPQNINVYCNASNNILRQNSVKHRLSLPVLTPYSSRWRCDCMPALVV